MKILLRNQKQPTWRKLEPKVFTEEKKLEELLRESPDLLPTEGKPVVFFKSQVPLGANILDLLGVDADGQVVIVECKLETNRDIRRTVVGQVLEYAAQLWRMDFKEFEELFTNDPDLSLSKLVRQRISDDKWSEENFHVGVRRALEKGDFRLVIAVSSINDSLKQILEYLNTRGSIRVEALELQQFKDEDGNKSVLVPEIYGRGERTARPPTTIRTLLEWLENYKNDAERDYFRSRMGLHHEILQNSLAYRVSGTVRWYVIPGTQRARVVQRGRFAGDEKLWQQHLSEPEAVCPRRGGTYLGFYLSKREDFEFFQNTMEKQAADFSWRAGDVTAEEPTV